MPTSSSPRIPLLLTTSVLLLTACGGGGGGGGGSPGKPALALTNFQAADFVIGQPDFESTDTGEDATNMGRDFYGAGYGNGTLYFASGDNNRVLGFNSLPSTNNPSPDFVLGQPDYTSWASGNGADQMHYPIAATVGDGKLFVSDVDNERILIFSPTPQAGPATATQVLGETDFGAQDGGDCSAMSISGSGSLIVAGGKLIISDTQARRVLIWNSLPTENGQPADLVLGQANFSSCEENRGGDARADTLSRHAGVWSDGNRLVVTDSFNNRVLIWNSFPTENGQPADLVLGQADFTGTVANDDNQDRTRDPAPSARTFDLPTGVTSNGDWLFVSDHDNHRVLVWNTFPSEDFQPADFVLGQADFTHFAPMDANQDGDSDETASANTFDRPSSVTLAEDRHLIVSDTGNRRYLVFDLGQ